MYVDLESVDVELHCAVPELFKIKAAVNVEMPVYRGSTVRSDSAADALKQSIDRIKTKLTKVMGMRFCKKIPSFIYFDFAYMKVNPNRLKTQHLFLNKRNVGYQR